MRTHIKYGSISVQAYRNEIPTHKSQTERIENEKLSNWQSKSKKEDDEEKFEDGVLVGWWDAMMPMLLLYACTIGLHAKVIITPVSAIYLHSKSRYFISFALSPFAEELNRMEYGKANEKARNVNECKCSVGWQRKCWKNLP